MKKLLLIVIAVIATGVFFANLIPLIALGVSALVLIYAWKKLDYAQSKWSKALLVIVGLIALSAFIANSPSLFALVAVYILYIVYKKWNEMNRVKSRGF